MDAALRPLIGDAGTVTPYQLHLQMVQGIDVGKTVFDGTRQRSVVGQALLGAGDELQGQCGKLPLGFNCFEDAPTQLGVGDQFGIA